MATWGWDSKTARYRDLETGRFLSEERVLEYVAQSIGNGYPAVEQLAGYVANGTINADTWALAMREEIKGEYVRQYLLGRGGVEQMTQADWGSIGGSLKEQYKYLNGFKDVVAAGDLSEAQIAARSKMYISSAREAYERGKARAVKKAGLDEVSWNVNPAVENCPDCLTFAAMGWQKVADNPYGGAYPGSGSTVCLTNCSCSLNYRKTEVKGE